MHLAGRAMHGPNPNPNPNPNQASVEPCMGVPKLQRLPMSHSISQLNEIEPAARDFKLRCDLYEGVGLPIGPIEAVYVVLSWGGIERQSAKNSPSEGKVRLESAVLGTY
eukprot:scaffold25039_cov69-Phaeocystis_antarctica.AAC.8